MGELELTPVHKEMIQLLIGLYKSKKRAIRGEEIAKIVGRNPGTIRNQMQTLKSLGIVDGVPGPKGGYKPTEKAYEILGLSIGKEEIVPVYKNGQLMKDITVEEINFKAVGHVDICQAHVKILGNIKDFNVDDAIEIGPTPVNKIIIRGKVIGRDDIENILICLVTKVLSLPKRPVIEYVSKELVTIPSSASIQEASRILLEKEVDRALITEKGKIVGIITFKDIGKAVANGKLQMRVGELGRKEVISIEGDKTLYEAAQLINKYGVGSLLVTVNGEPRGLMPRTAILKEFAVYK
ncbi:MAG: CBS domain-containing protein [Candidatus Methanospirareceae archaeon]